MIGIMGFEELTALYRTVVDRARKIERFLSQPLFVAEVFTRIAGKYLVFQTLLLGLVGFLVLINILKNFKKILFLILYLKILYLKF